MAKNNCYDVQLMQFLLKDLYIYFNYDAAVAEARKTHGPNYMRDKQTYWDRAIYNLEKVFTGKSENEIKLLFFDVFANEVKEYLT